MTAIDGPATDGTAPGLPAPGGPADNELWCDRCGAAVSGASHDACVAARALEPPRFCPRCRRRMKVQVLPAGWSATCVAHGEIRAAG